MHIYNRPPPPLQPPFHFTYRFHVHGVEQIEGNSGQQIQQEPALDIIDSNQLGVVDDLSALTHKGGAEVEYYV